jgi:asparagine synthase (glutamine-hydrolysing)
MCGIAGIVDPSLALDRVEGTVERMLPGIASRGPDGVGRYCTEGVGLLHTRLAIIDLTTGDQPIWNERRTVACVFNGEIYNYRQLRADLQARGHALATTSDTEVLVHLYEDFGQDMLRHVHGMYAFAIHDTERRHVLVARDRLGIKPLYVARVGGGVAFASSIDSLLEAGAKRSIDFEALAQYLRFHEIPEPRTAYRDVRALLPGHLLAIDVRTGVAEERRFYRRPAPSVAAGDPRDAVGRARKAFEHAVGTHLIADVEVAAFLSGGIDSSLVVGQAQRLAGRPLRTFCMSFRGSGVPDEAPFAERVAKQLGTRHETLEVSEPPGALVRRALVATQQPFAVASFLPLLLLCEQAAREVKVVLTGDGGDEVGFGYPWYGWSRATGRSPRLRTPRVLHALRGAERRAAQYPGLRSVRRGLKFARGMFDGGARGSDAWRYDLTADEGAAALHPAHRSELVAEPSPTERAWDGELSSVDAMRCADLEVLLRDEMLPKLDRAGMAFGLEGRVPLLDDDFVEAMLAVPASVHLAHRHGKAVLRSWAAEMVPGVDVERKKHGFDVPIHGWLEGDLRDDVDRLLLRPSRPGLIDPGFAQRVWAQAQAHGSGAGHAIYAMLVAALWFEKS